MDQHDINAVAAEALEARSQGPADTVFRVVVNERSAGCAVEEVSTLDCVFGVDEQVADFCRDHRLADRSIGQEGAETFFRQSRPVLRGGVKGANPLVPRGLENGLGSLVLDGGVHPGQGRTAQHQPCHMDVATAETDSLDATRGCGDPGQLLVHDRRSELEGLPQARRESGARSETDTRSDSTTEVPVGQLAIFHAPWAPAALALRSSQDLKMCSRITSAAPSGSCAASRS